MSESQKFLICLNEWMNECGLTLHCIHAGLCMMRRADILQWLSLGDERTDRLMRTISRHKWFILHRSGNMWGWFGGLSGLLELFWEIISACISPALSRLGAAQSVPGAAELHLRRTARPCPLPLPTQKISTHTHTLTHTHSLPDTTVPIQPYVLSFIMQHAQIYQQSQR